MKTMGKDKYKRDLTEDLKAFCGQFSFAEEMKEGIGYARQHDICLSDESISRKLFGCNNASDAIKMLECIHEMVGLFYLANAHFELYPILLADKIAGIQCVMRLEAELLCEIMRALDSHLKTPEREA